MIATRSSRGGAFGITSAYTFEPCPLSTPNRSQTYRLSPRIAIGWSIGPRRHAISHGAAHTRPQIEGNGFGRRAIRYASSSSPAAIAAT